MNILGERYTDRQVIGLSGHKSEGTVEQYARKLSSKIKKDMSGTLATNILPKVTPSANKFTFKSTKPAETASKPPPEDAPVVNMVQDNIPINPPENVQYEYQALDINAEPVDDMLIAYLSQFDEPNQQQVSPPEANVLAPQQIQQQPQQHVIPPILPQQQMASNPIQAVANNTMNIQHNIQNVNPGQRMPVLYFPGSNVTINYNFGK